MPRGSPFATFSIRSGANNRQPFRGSFRFNLNRQSLPICPKLASLSAAESQFAESRTLFCKSWRV